MGEKRDTKPTDICRKDATELLEVDKLFILFNFNFKTIIETIEI